MMQYETAEKCKNSRSFQALVEEMRNLPEGVKTVYDDYTAGTQTLVYKDGRCVTRSLNKKPSTKPSTSRSVKSSAASELKASLKKTMREADQNISDFTKRIAQLDVEISRATMRGQYAGTMKCKRDDLLQRINKLKAIKSRCSALLCGA